VEATQVLTLPAILALGVVYGTDVFFAVVARPALAKVSEASLTEVMGRLHEYADRRMPFFGVLGMVCTLGLLVAAPGVLAAVALAAQAVHLGLYFGVAKPVNAALTAAATRGESLPDARRLQRRWDGVIIPRALLLGAALACLALLAALSA
jgi:Domain of unknown function (DUF1772).